MASAAFNSALTFILRWEGGFVDHPNDPGGRTNRGVTQKVYDQWRAQKAAPARDVKLIEEAEVKAIYESQYWVPPRCDILQEGLDLVQFDTAVNMGVGRAIKFLQSSLKCTPDGSFGPGTQRAVTECDFGSTVAGYCEIREAYYRGLAEKNAKLNVFLKGWLNRLNALRKQIGLPGYESAKDWDPAAEPALRIPDLGVDPAFDI